MISIVFAALFLVALFLVKTGFIFKNPLNSVWYKKEGLTYSTATIGNLVYKDTDRDGIPDWEEPLWGLDPTNKETTPGVPDISVINKLKANGGSYSILDASGNTGYSENLTETDKFSRELFSTVATLNQTGSMDQSTIDKISTSLAEQIKNSSQKKVYLISDILIIKNDSTAAIKKYNDTLDDIHSKYPIKGSVTEILQKFIVDENNVDIEVLNELDPIINTTQNIIDAVVKLSVPQSLSLLHLDFINALERYTENLKDIKLFESDPIIALAAISQFEKNIISIESSMVKLNNLINQKLNN